MRRFLQLLQSDQRGVTSIEYGLIIMAITLSMLAAYFLAGDALEDIMMTAVSGLEHANSTIGGGFDHTSRFK